MMDRFSTQPKQDSSMNAMDSFNEIQNEIQDGMRLRDELREDQLQIGIICALSAGCGYGLLQAALSKKALSFWGIQLDIWSCVFSSCINLVVVFITLLNYRYLTRLRPVQLIGFR